MKPATRNVLVALGLFVAFAVAYHWHEPRSKPIVTTEQARQLPAIIPPQPKFEEDEESRLRREHRERLDEIQAQELRAIWEKRSKDSGVLLMPLPPDHPYIIYFRTPAEPAKPDPARPVEPLEPKTR